jgi:hypothetical protein
VQPATLVRDLALAAFEGHELGEELVEVGEVVVGHLPEKIGGGPRRLERKTCATRHAEAARINRFLG